MSMDFRKNTYRPHRPDSRFRTSYALMSQWMSHVGNRARAADGHQSVPLMPEKNSAGNVFGRKSRMVNSEGAPSPYIPDAAQLAAMDDSIPPHVRYSHNNGYDDFHKSYQQVSQQFPNKHFPVFGPPKLRHGRAGGSWRHVKEVLQAGGRRIVFVDGQIAYEDSIRIDDVPKGHLIKPDARQRRPVSRSMSVGQTDNKINAVRNFYANQACVESLPTMYGLETKKGLEQTNWAVIR